MSATRKPLEFWADALDVLWGCPAEVRLRVGFALDEAELGGERAVPSR